MSILNDITKELNNMSYDNLVKVKDFVNILSEPEAHDNTTKDYKEFYAECKLNIKMPSMFSNCLLFKCFNKYRVRKKDNRFIVVGEFGIIKEFNDIEFNEYFNVV